jgi:hypothetical protein
MKDNSLSHVTESYPEQSIHPVPEYEAIQLQQSLGQQKPKQAFAKSSPYEVPSTSNEPSIYQELNLSPKSSTTADPKPIYEPLRSKSTKSTEPQHYDNTYQPLGLRNQSSDYQTLHIDDCMRNTNVDGSESII